MKHLLIVGIFIGSTFLANSQSVSGSGKKSKSVRKSPAQMRGTGQYHGSKDTTPGSPMGTGGAGGSGMSGSPKGSESKTALQQSKAGTTANEKGRGGNSRVAKKGTAKRKVR
jgi:hypothetical protein